MISAAWLFVKDQIRSSPRLPRYNDAIATPLPPGHHNRAEKAKRFSGVGLSSGGAWLHQKTSRETDKCQRENDHWSKNRHAAHKPSEQGKGEGKKNEHKSPTLTATNNSASHVVELGQTGARRSACNRPPSGSQEDIGSPDQSGPTSVHG